MDHLLKLRRSCRTCDYGICAEMARRKGWLPETAPEPLTGLPPDSSSDLSPGPLSGPLSNSSSDLSPDPLSGPLSDSGPDASPNPSLEGAFFCCLERKLLVEPRLDCPRWRASYDGYDAKTADRLPEE